MRKAVLILIILTIISKISGFFRDITLAYFYGASGISDAFLISITIPTVVFGIIAAGISTGYIPMYSRIENSFGAKQGRYFTNNLIHILLIFCTIIIGFAFIFTESLVKIFASGFEGEILQLAIVLTRISITGIYFTIVIRILSAYLNYKNLFAVPSLIGIPMNIILIIAIILSHKTELIVLLAIGNVAALLVQFILIVTFSYKKGYKYEMVLRPKDKHIKEMLYIAVPVILGSSVTQINKLVDRTLASQVSIGGISSLNYANTLNTSFLGIFVASISTVMFPAISRMAAKENLEGLKKALNQSIIGVALLVTPATVASLIFAEPIVRFLFGRGAFDSQALMMTDSAFFFYSIGMIGSGLRVLLSKAFYSLQDTKTPMVNAAIAMVLNIILNFILSRYLGIGGLALATSIASIFTAILLFVSLRKKLGRMQLSALLRSFIKIAAAAVISGIISLGVYQLLTAVMIEGAALFISIGVLIFLYFVLAYAMKIEALNNISKTVIGRFFKNR